MAWECRNSLKVSRDDCLLSEYLGMMKKSKISLRKAVVMLEYLDAILLITQPMEFLKKNNCAYYYKNIR